MGFSLLGRGPSPFVLVLCTIETIVAFARGKTSLGMKFQEKAWNCPSSIRLSQVPSIHLQTIYVFT